MLLLSALLKVTQTRNKGVPFYVGKYLNALINTMSNVDKLWDEISKYFAFNVVFQMLKGSIITLSMFVGILRYF